MEFDAAGLVRRTFLRRSLLGAAAGILLTLEGCAGGVRRRTRRRTRRRVRRRVAWRTVGARRLLVVPVDIEPGDELQLEDGRVGTVVVLEAETVVLEFDGRRETLAALFEGEVGEE
ncbi:MAG: hypothetical protein ACT4PV_05435 [Planctomycetaceae bacterium]